MEVHHHSHTARKRFFHYFWEFFMLFLAVTLGFFVENQREHYIEHQREKQYMRSMLEDLKQDTAEINTALSFIDSTLVPNHDTSLSLLFLETYPDSIVEKMYSNVPLSSQSFSFSFQDRTTMQLKNSGNLRLIRNREITDSLADYWYSANSLQNILLYGYEETRKKTKDLIFSLFNFNNYKNYSPWSGLQGNKPLRLLENDPVNLKQLGNHIANLRSQLVGPFILSLYTIKKKADNLIHLIIDKYHLN